MSEPSTAANMSLAQGVMETIIAIAAKEVRGVASLVSPSTGVLQALFSPKDPTDGVEVTQLEDGRLGVSLHLQAYYGYNLPSMADEVREAIADALRVQAGLEVARVDVFVDAIAFE